MPTMELQPYTPRPIGHPSLEGIQGNAAWDWVPSGEGWRAATGCGGISPALNPFTP
jgi:hypothetical protein